MFSPFNEELAKIECFSFMKKKGVSEYEHT